MKKKIKITPLNLEAVIYFYHVTIFVDNNLPIFKYLFIIIYANYKNHNKNLN